MSIKFLLRAGDKVGPTFRVPSRQERKNDAFIWRASSSPAHKLINGHAGMSLTDESTTAVPVFY